MSNRAFLEIINRAFQVYLETGSRSDKKLKVLHAFIAKEIAKKLGENFCAISLNEENSHEEILAGKYYDKKVDIAIFRAKKPVAGIAVKFVMSNYAQNSNNYFENMLGETANLRANKIPYFQILILTENAPYFKNDREKTISKIEKITKKNLHKYMVLSNDNTDLYLHSPNKTLIYIVKNSRGLKEFIGKSKDEFVREMQKDGKLETCEIANVEFGENIILNDFEEFAEKISHFILSL